MQKVFCEGMVQYLDMKPELVERLFPQAQREPHANITLAYLSVGMILVYPSTFMILAYTGADMILTYSGVGLILTYSVADRIPARPGAGMILA